jgi:hypothetical protein
MDEQRLEEFATGESPSSVEEEVPEDPPQVASSAAPQIAPSRQAAVAAGLNINVEIHIAADAKAATIEEIFKNMRKYLFDGSDSTADGG